MKYGLIFLTCGMGALALYLQTDIASLLLCWCGVSFVIVGIAYAGLGAKVFGKQSDGRMAWRCAINVLRAVRIARAEHIKQCE